MKNIFIAAFALLGMATASANEHAITEQQLPAAARNFIQTHYANHKIIVASQDQELFDTDYTVLLDEGTKIEFDSKGNWEKISHRGGQIPRGIIPVQIKDFAKQYFPASHIVKIEHDREGYEVELQGDIELKFDKKFNCVEVDR